MDHAEHKRCALPATGLNLPSAHETQVRSLETVAAMAINSPGPHGLLTRWHGVLLFIAEYVVPVRQGAHSRSAVRHGLDVL